MLPRELVTCVNSVHQGLFPPPPHKSLETKAIHGLQVEQFVTSFFTCTKIDFTILNPESTRCSTGPKAHRN